MRLQIQGPVILGSFFLLLALCMGTWLLLEETSNRLLLFLLSGDFCKKGFTLLPFTNIPAESIPIPLLKPLRALLSPRPRFCRPAFPVMLEKTAMPMLLIARLRPVSLLGKSTVCLGNSTVCLVGRDSSPLCLNNDSTGGDCMYNGVKVVCRKLGQAFPVGNGWLSDI